MTKMFDCGVRDVGFLNCSYERKELNLAARLEKMLELARKIYDNVIRSCDDAEVFEIISGEPATSDKARGIVSVAKNATDKESRGLCFEDRQDLILLCYSIAHVECVRLAYLDYDFEVAAMIMAAFEELYSETTDDHDEESNGL